MVPVAGAMLSPVGSVGITLYVRDPVPPVPVTGVNVVATWFWVSTVEATTGVATTTV